MTGKIRRRDMLKFTAGASFLAAMPAIVRGAEPAAGSAAKPGTFTVVQNGNAASNGPFLKSIRDFETRNPGVTVNVEFIPAPTWVQYMATLQIRLAGGAKYDAVYLAAETQRTFAQKGILQPLDSFVAGDKDYIDVYYQDVQPRLLDTFRRHEVLNNKTYFLPHAFNVMGIWFNRKTLAANGIEAPKAGWTWDNFHDIAVQMKKAGHYGFNSATDLFQGVCPWVLTNGGHVLDDTWTKSEIASPAAVEAATFVRGLIADGLAPAIGGTFDQYTATINGKLAMTGAPAGAALNFAGHFEDIGVLHWPKKVTNGTPIGIGAYGILSSSARPDLAWQFIKWMIDLNTQVNFIAAAGKQPLRTTALADPNYLKLLPDGGHYLGDSLDYAELVPGSQSATQVEAEVETQWKQILSGNVSPKDGLVALHEQIQPQLTAP
jgi:multiple sugar transport system substrate-binding protein